MSKEVFAYVVATVGGPGLIAWSVRCYRGRTPRARRWVGDRVDERSVIFVYPALGVALCFGPLSALVPINPATALLLGPPVIFAFFWGFYGMIAFLPIPKFLYPKWARK